jgi:hypothetical protein
MEECREFGWNKARNATLTNVGMGVTVSILHTGKHYADDLSEGDLWSASCLARITS